MFEFAKRDLIQISENKTQIVLCHTSREVEEYLTSLRIRYRYMYDKIPNYVVDREGRIKKFLDDVEYTNFFGDENLNNKSIIVMLENLGWLEKKPLSDVYINWIGNIYKGQVYDKKWRDYIYWQPYTDYQLESLANLCRELVSKNKLSEFVINHNVKIEGIEKVNGIVSRSNFDTIYTDLNPSFDFEKFKKLIYE